MNQIKNLRESRGWTQEELAQKLSVNTHTVSNWEQGLRAPNATSRKLLAIVFKVHEAKLFISDKDFDLLKASNFPPIETSEPEPPLVVWADFYEMDKKSILTKGGKKMFRVIVEDDDNAPDIAKTDILWLINDLIIKDRKYYIFKDLLNKTVILRQLRQYKDAVVLSTKNLKFEHEFDSKRFEVIARVFKHEREL